MKEYFIGFAAGFSSAWMGFLLGFLWWKLIGSVSIGIKQIHD